MRFSNLNEWLQWQESLHSSEIDLGLARVSAVAANMRLIASQPSSALQFAENQPTVITVAGTNGKGSCIATLEYLLLALGFCVGAYSSPHFLHYNERIRVNGQPAPDVDICQAFDNIDRARGDTSLSYFEFGTLAGLEIFRQQQLDYVLLEVGLGGRLDAVNIVDADLAIITAIALDHEDWLGSDIEQIGREKAGIARKNQKLICADRKVPQSVLDISSKLNCKLYRAGLDFYSQESALDWSLISNASSNVSSHNDQNLPLPSLPLPSVAAAIMALRALELPLDTKLLQTSLPHIHLSGRYQQIDFRGRQLILDVAHNPAAAYFLAQRLQQSSALHNFTGASYALIAMMADKDIPQVLAPLHSQVQHWIAAGLDSNPRAATAEFMALQLQAMGANVQQQTTVLTGFEYFLKHSDVGDRLLVLGSFFTVAAILQRLEDV